jgi:hypothetical protein
MRYPQADHAQGFLADLADREHTAKAAKASLEAGVGIEPAYTALQAAA